MKLFSFSQLKAEFAAASDVPASHRTLTYWAKQLGLGSYVGHSRVFDQKDVDALVERAKSKGKHGVS